MLYMDFRKYIYRHRWKVFLCFSDSHGTSNLSEIEVDGQNKNYKSQDGVLYSKDMKQLLLYPLPNKDVSYSVPEGVDYIKDIIDVQHLKILYYLNRFFSNLWSYHC